MKIKSLHARYSKPYAPECTCRREISKRKKNKYEMEYKINTILYYCSLKMIISRPTIEYIVI